MGTDAGVVVVGAGPAGSALAAFLGRSGIDTVVLDRASFPRDKVCGEGLMPSGVRVARELGVPVDCFPALGRVTYRVPDVGAVSAEFGEGISARGVRRATFDGMLVAAAGATPHVEVRQRCSVTGLERRGSAYVVMTCEGELSARIVVGADGLRSNVARWMGWSRPPRLPHRFGLIAHPAVPRHGIDGVIVTVLDGCEVYTTPTGPDELLVAVLGTRDGLRRNGERVLDAYARHVGRAHPEIDVASVDVRGAGPFGVRPSRVASTGVFLIGDAAGFLDPLTGEGMSEALVAAEKLGSILASRTTEPERAYGRWEATQWRRRLVVSRIARLLTGTSSLRTRALRSIQRRPVTLRRLLEVNDGRRSLWSLTVRDWAALAGV